MLKSIEPCDCVHQLDHPLVYILDMSAPYGRTIGPPWIKGLVSCPHLNRRQADPLDAETASWAS